MTAIQQAVNVAQDNGWDVKIHPMGGTVTFVSLREDRRIFASYARSTGAVLDAASENCTLIAAKDRNKLRTLIEYLQDN